VREDVNINAVDGLWAALVDVFVVVVVSRGLQLSRFSLGSGGDRLRSWKGRDASKLARLLRDGAPVSDGVGGGEVIVFNDGQRTCRSRKRDERVSGRRLGARDFPYKGIASLSIAARFCRKYQKRKRKGRKADEKRWTWPKSRRIPGDPGESPMLLIILSRYWRLINDMHDGDQELS
jgi:hypothetical protein